MKKFLIYILSVCLIFSIAGCDKNSTIKEQNNIASNVAVPIEKANTIKTITESFIEANVSLEDWYENRDSVSFGTYQGIPIEWMPISISESGKKATLISKYVLDYIPIEFDEIRERDLKPHYKNTSIFKFANEEFYNNAFSDSEKSMIIHNIADNSGYRIGLLRKKTHNKLLKECEDNGEGEKKIYFKYNKWDKANYRKDRDGSKEGINCWAAKLTFYAINKRNEYVKSTKDLEGYWGRGSNGVVTAYETDYGNYFLMDTEHELLSQPYYYDWYNSLFEVRLFGRVGLSGKIVENGEVADYTSFFGFKYYSGFRPVITVKWK